MPSPPKVGDEVEMECTKLAFGGRGIGKLPGSGFVVFCDRAVPGERVVARITALKKGGRFAEAVKVAVLAQSLHATEAPCPHFDQCGGCTWQDVAYAGQLAFKREQVLDVLTRIAKMDNAADVVKAIVPAPATERYRNKMTFAFEPTRGASQNAASPLPPPALGLRPLGRHDAVVQITPEGCLLQHPLADAVVARCEAHLREMPEAASALPAFDRRTGAGVLRSLTVRTSSGCANANGDGCDLAVVDIAAAVDGAPRGRFGEAAAAAALEALAADLAAVPGVHGVVHTRVEAEPELRRVEGRHQGWVKGGRGGGAGKGKGRARGAKSGGRGGSGGVGDDASRDDNNPSDGGEGWERGNTTVLQGSPTLPMTLRGVSFSLSAPSFFQTNSEQAERLVAEVEAACGFSGSNTEVVLDLFCGVGTLGLCVASKAKHVYGWEVVPEAVKDAKRNAASNGITNATFRRGDLAKLKSSLPGLGGKAKANRNGGDETTEVNSSIDEALGHHDGEDVLPAPDIVIADPARAGMSKSLVKVLRDIGARRVVYVSCNPATQARDILGLCGGGGNDDDESGAGAAAARYRVLSVTPVDMFPHTPHVETVAVLERVVE